MILYPDWETRRHAKAQRCGLKSRRPPWPVHCEALVAVSPRAEKRGDGGVVDSGTKVVAVKK
jgi:hypothetical protein